VVQSPGAREKVNADEKLRRIKMTVQSSARTDQGGSLAAHKCRSEGIIIELAQNVNRIPTLTSIKRRNEKFHDKTAKLLDFGKKTSWGHGSGQWELKRKKPVKPEDATVKSCETPV